MSGDIIFKIYFVRNVESAQCLPALPGVYEFINTDTCVKFQARQTA